MLDLYKEFQTVTEHIINVKDGLEKSQEYTDKLQEEIDILNNQKKLLERNICVLKQKGVVSLIDEFSKVKKELKGVVARINVLSQERDQVKKAMSNQEKTLSRLQEKLDEIKYKIDQNKNNIIIFRK